MAMLQDDGRGGEGVVWVGPSAATCGSTPAGAQAMPNAIANTQQNCLRLPLTLSWLMALWQLSANRRVVRACWMSSLHRPTRTHLRLVHRTIARPERHSSATDRRAALLLLLPRHHLGKGALTASAMVNHRILSDESRHRLNFRLVQKTLSTVTPPVTRDEFWFPKN